ncbi:MAG: 16S rRNA (uracil(1498)-N(3))-methyltransferase [Deinococcota bacterium]
MRVHRVHLPRLTSYAEAENVSLQGREAHHLLHVLRVQVGQHLRVFDGQGQEAEAVIDHVDDATITLRISTPQASEVESSWRIYAAIGLLKGDKLADVVRQLTELGVGHVQPFTSRFGDVPKASPNKLARWRRVAAEAAKQSGRSVVPEVAEPISIETLERPSATSLGIVAHPYASRTLAEVLKDHQPSEQASINLVTGPEGGLAEAEVERLEAKGFHPVSLGPRILRAETAPIALVAALLLPEGR